MEKQVAAGKRSCYDVVKLRLVGSSYGGWLASRYAELHGDKVDSILCVDWISFAPAVVF